MGATVLTALLRRDEAGGASLHAPAVGVWVDPPRAGARVRAGEALGALRVLDRRHPLVAPSGVDGLVAEPLMESGERAVQVGERLFAVAPLDVAAAGGVAAGTPGEGAEALPVRSPIDGIVYLRPTPGAPPFVEVGGEVTEGQTVALVEVMKTFHPLRYGGPGLPPRARVVSIEVQDGAEVRQGQVLARVEGV